jgi:hypothetical protein
MFELFDRALSLLDKWIDRRYPVIQEPHGEVWRQGDPLPEPKTAEEYRDFPRDQPGRFTQAIAAAQRNSRA